MGMEDDGLDDVEEWEQNPSVPIALDAVVPLAIDAIGEFNRACQGGAMPILDKATTTQSVHTPERRLGAQSMTEQSRRTRSPRSALLTRVAAGRPPAETQALGPIVPVHPSARTLVAVGRQTVETRAVGVVVPVHPNTPQLRRAMPRVPPMPGDSPGGPIDVDDLLAAAVDTEFFYKPELDHYEATSNALRK